MLHKLLATTAFSAFVLGSTFVSATAHAKDPEHYFYPKSKWVVDRVESTSDRELHSCTISNQLNNGYRVQIAGTANGFTNINLDLKQNVFDAGKRYEVIYQVPGVAKAALPTRAFQQNLLVSDLRDQTEFVNAMRESGVLDVNIRGNEFRIYMTGFDAKMQSFTQCVDAGLDVAENSAAGTAETQTSAAQIIEVPAEPPSSTALTSAKSVDGPLGKPEPRERFTEQIEEEIKQGNSKYLPDEQSKAQAAELKSVQADAEDDDALDMIEPQKKPFVRTTTSKISANVDFTGTPSQINARHPGNIEPASGSAGTAKLIGNDYSALQAEMEQLRKQVTSLRNQNKMLDEELRAVSVDSQTEAVSVASDNWNLERATMRFEEAERQTLRLGRQLKTERARCEMEKEELETLLFDPQLTNKTQLAKLASLENELEDSKAELLRQKRRYDERIKLLEAQLSAQ